jgi:dihydrofolate reductase
LPELRFEISMSLAAWREPHGREGGATNSSTDVITESLERTGATIMGRGMFGGGEGPWGEDPWEGWWGDEPPFGHPVFVLTNHEREPLTKGATTFTFVTEGIESALERAREAAGEKDVLVAGGGNVGQQYIAAGLLDELQIHLVPVLLGDGVRLFDQLGGLELELTRVVDSPAVTHLRYRQR